MLTFNLLCNKFIVKGHVMSIFWPGEAKFWDKVNTDSDSSNPHMMLGGATHVMVLPLVFKEDAH